MPLWPTAYSALAEVMTGKSATKWKTATERLRHGNDFRGISQLIPHQVWAYWAMSTGTGVCLVKA